MRIANKSCVTGGLEMLEVRTEMFGNPRTIYPALLRDGGTALPVDTGYPGQFAAMPRGGSRNWRPRERQDILRS